MTKNNSYGKHFWNKIAKHYASIQKRTNTPMYKELIARCSTYITKQDAVCELACGTGQLSIPLHTVTKNHENSEIVK